MATCPNCSKTVDDHAAICTFCGALISSGAGGFATRSLGDTDFEDTEARWGTARFLERMNLIVRLRDSATAFVYDAAAISELVIGRFDHETGTGPELDLAKYGAADKGVSRRHAAIVRRDGALSLVDLGSPNGTFLNGHRLIAHQPRILRDGDDVRLGHLVLEILFERDQTTMP